MDLSKEHLCPLATQAVFKFCRPMLVIDACQIRLSCVGIIMSAFAHDGNGEIVPLASAFADIEKERNWKYFLTLPKQLFLVSIFPGLFLCMTEKKACIRPRKQYY